MSQNKILGKKDEGKKKKKISRCEVEKKKTKKKKKCADKQEKKKKKTETEKAMLLLPTATPHSISKNFQNQSATFFPRILSDNMTKIPKKKKRYREVQRRAEVK
jgi:hypothetical protein